MKCFSAVAFLSAFFLMACATVSSVPSLPSPVPDTQEIPSVRSGHPGETVSWSISPSNQPQSYTSLLTTVITQLEASTTRRDSLSTRAHYSVSTTRSADTLLLTGSITEFFVERDKVDIERGAISTPFAFTAKLSSHNFITQISSANQTQDPTNCENPAQTALTVLQRNLFLLPLQLTTAQTWSDSISSVTCSGTLPVTHTVIRTFTVVGPAEVDGNPAIFITEKERTFSKGEGSQEQHRILIEGEGLTIGNLYLDPVSGILLTSNSTNRTTLSIQSSGRVQHFLQNSSEITQKSH